MKRFLSAVLPSILYIIVVSLFSSFFSTSVIAQSAAVNMSYYDWSSTLGKNKAIVLGAATPSADLYRFGKYLFGANLTPETPFYLLKRAQENLSLFTTFDKVEKEKLKLGIASERL